MEELKKRGVFRDESGHLSVKVPMPTALPDICVTLRSGHTTYRFTGRYDGKHSLAAKLLKSMEQNHV